MKFFQVLKYIVGYCKLTLLKKKKKKDPAAFQISFKG